MKDHSPEANLAKIKELEKKAADRNFFSTAEKQINDTYSARIMNYSQRFDQDTAGKDITTNKSYYENQDDPYYLVFAGPNKTVQSMCKRFNVDPDDFISINPSPGTPVYVKHYSTPGRSSRSIYRIFGTISPTGKLIEDMIYNIPNTTK